MANVAQLTEFDEIVDVRTPAEFAEDHVPGAVNRPVLSDEERSRVGILYKQVSAFTGRKVGAALVSRNIATHVEASFMDKPKSWRPLVYCWRGGKRSEAMVHVLREIGWDAQRLEGGYRAYRRAVVAELPQLAQRYRMCVVCGLTGSGKSLLLEALDRLGAQVLDLEKLAAHRGSVLGNLPHEAQPAQKMFESGVWWRLRSFDPQQTVFVESESKRIGSLHVPDELLISMWGSECIWVETDTPTRVALLKEQYGHFLADPTLLGKQLDCLMQLHGRAAIERWKALAQRGEWDPLVRELLERHYDPAYTHSIVSHYPALGRARRVRLSSPAQGDLASVGRNVLDTHASATVPPS
ncbi:MAG TPA: tRNA 2-selenouridine(34) synthase MnmH [Burkholderiales bacterium]|nr:tRNA 2-selenouridine(34) synthase MnmH [Burkholderiales bacterium]